MAWAGESNTSLYWFNLSLKSLAKFPDLIEPIARVNREIRILDEIFLNGAAFEHRRLEADGRPSWDLTSIATPTTILLAAHDLQYQADLSKREFVFSERSDFLEFQRPTWLGELLYVFRIDADGTHDVTHAVSASSILIEDSIKVVGIYAATSDKTLRDRFKRQHAALLAKEHAVTFDPANNKNDLELLSKHATN